MTVDTQIIIDAQKREVGGFAVRRLLPSRIRRAVGPFVFFDHMGPARFAPGEGMDVPPHPHIGLATVTYLFEGEIVHRDSLGFQQPIRPGDINWMTAGHGITHSERTSPEVRRAESRLHGLQLWVALPKAHEEMEPSFHHHAAASLPERDEAGVRVRLLVGTAYGMRSPVQTLSPMFYLDAALPAGGELRLPREHEERALYVADGAVEVGADSAAVGRMLAFLGDTEVVVRAESPARIVVLGGAPLDGERHLFWNYVSSSPERLEQAKRDWKEGRFPKVVGDEGA